MRAERIGRQRSQRGSTTGVREACGRDSPAFKHFWTKNQRLRSENAELKAAAPGNPFATPPDRVRRCELCSYSIAVDASPVWSSAAWLQG